MLRLMYILTAAAFVALLGFACSPSHADGWADHLTPVAIGSPNSGAFLGAGVGYELHDHLWADLFAKRSQGETTGAAGLSTDLQNVADLIGSVLSFEVPRIPAGAAVGGAVDTNGDTFLYFGWHTDIGF